MITAILLCAISWIATTTTTAQNLTSEGCGSKRSCWFQPGGCETTDIGSCVSSVQWTTESDGVVFEFQATIRDLTNTFNGRWIAIGFSKDDRMGDDSVIECIFKPSGDGNAYLSFNDMTHNRQLLQATTVALAETSGQIVDDRMMCKVKWLYGGREKVFEEDRFKVFDLESRPWTMQIARGEADHYSFSKMIHSTHDGDLFPWVTTSEVHVCRNCSDEKRFQYIKDMKQTDISRYWRYRIATIHGILLMFAWWVLASSAILMARFFKPLWPNTKLFGTAIWFQAHRNCLFVSVIIQVIAVFLIFLQSSFTWYGCTYECNAEAFGFKLHVNLGFSATVAALIQPFLALIRPGPDSNWRPWFNWVHWFLGMGAWLCATITFFLAVQLGKTGLHRNFQQTPYYIMGVYIATFVICSIALEIIASQSTMRTQKIGQHGMELNLLNGPSTEDPGASYPPRASLRPVFLVIHLLVAIAATCWISYMLIYNLEAV
uniref:Cytochrome b561 domain-containing protein n=1 Tax=Plectus sambesii TaxID=2011161 RepID=A0A914UQ97_9BILA